MDGHSMAAISVHLPSISSITRSCRGKKIRAAGKSTSLTIVRLPRDTDADFPTEASARLVQETVKKKRRKFLTLGGLKADQLRILALTGAVKGSHSGVVKRVEVQPIYRANGLAATVHLLRIRFQTGHPYICGLQL